MGRKSLAAVRRLEILSATIQCIAEVGAAGLTLAVVADRVGMARGHVRHYVGNREQLVIDAARVFYFGHGADGCEDREQLPRIFPPDCSLDQILDFLFGEFSEPGWENSASSAFAQAALTIHQIQAIIDEYFDHIRTGLTESMLQQNPGTSPDDVSRTCEYVMIVALGAATAAEMTPHRSSAAAGRQLVAEIMRAARIVS